MKISLKKKTDTEIDKQIAVVFKAMDNVHVVSNEYLRMMMLLERLTKLKTEKRRQPVNWDTVVNLTGNVGLSLVVVAYEQKHVIGEAMKRLLRSVKI